MRTQPIFKDFDLPTQHLGNNHYVPAKAREEAEIERRQSMHRGMLLAEHQEKGLKVAANILHLVSDKDSVSFSSRLLAASGINSAWYGFARGAEHEVMRRRVKLPSLIAGNTEWRPNSSELRHNASTEFAEASALATKVVKGIEYHSPRTAEFKRSLGRTIGRASLTAACIELGDQVFGQPIIDSDVQLLVRQRSLNALSDARHLESSLGVAPSIAQFADPDSQLSVFWRRESPNGALKAYETAIELQTELTL